LIGAAEVWAGRSLSQVVSRELNSGRGNFSPDAEAPLVTAAYRVVFAALMAFWAVALIEWGAWLLALL
jgi:hypothetical protein